MPVIIKKNKRNRSKKSSGKKAMKYSNLPDLSKDPYFVKKAENAKELLKRSGILKD